MASQSKKRDLRQQHPIYQRMAARWEMAWDFWRGGIHVLAPDHDISRVEFAVENDTSGDLGAGEDPERAAATSGYRWVPAISRSYLWKNSNEGRREYDERCARAVHYPLFQFVVNILVSGILRTPAKRGEGEPQEPWATFWDDVDLSGTSIDIFDRMALALALVFGRIHAVVDRPNYGAEALSAGEQLERGERPYAYLCTPLDIIDWCIDERGQFVWVVIREPEPDVREPGYEPPECVRWQYRAWYRDRWELWRDKSDGGTVGGVVVSEPNFVLVETRAHPCGRVPIATLWAPRENRAATMACESPYADTLDYDRHFLNKSSELDEVERTQAFSVMYVPQVEGMSGGPIDISPFRAITGPVGAAPQFVSPPDAIPTGKHARIQEQMQAVRQLSAVTRGKSEYSKEERSAEALSVESEDKRNQMSSLAAATEEFDRQLHRLVNLWDERPQDDFPQPKYGRDFTLSVQRASMLDMVYLKGIPAIGSRAMALILRPIVSNMLKEIGVDDAGIAEVVAAIDERAAKVAEFEDFQREAQREALAAGDDAAMRDQFRRQAETVERDPAEEAAA